MQAGLTVLFLGGLVCTTGVTVTRGDVTRGDVTRGDVTRGDAVGGGLESSLLIKPFTCYAIKMSLVYLIIKREIT